MYLFYSTEIKNDVIKLDAEESKHCQKVLRFRQDDEIDVTNGEGKIFKARLIKVQPNHCEAVITEIKEIERKNFKIHIAIAITKNPDRFEWFVEKTAEIGIDEITPLITAKTERKNLNINRCEKILISAMKQSKSAWLPKINSTKNFTGFISENQEGQRFIAYCSRDKNQGLADLYRQGVDAIIIIGPEGDFTPEEIELAIHKGYTVVSLGNSILRTETAGIVACHTIHLLNKA